MAEESINGLGKIATFDSPPDRCQGTAILFVDDEPLMLVRLKNLCQKSSELASCTIFQAQNLDEAREIIATESIQVMTLDKNLGSKVDGINAIPEFLGLKPDLQILVHTGSSEIADVVSAMKKGAFGYITKDSEDALICAQIEKAVFHSKIASAKTRMERVSVKSAPLELRFKSQAMAKVIEKLKAVSESNRPVLLLGDTGVGKTTIAKGIHEYRKQYLKQNERSFYGINLTALAPNLIERELFGNEAGAYTGAAKRQVGFFELANNGTLFIDEIGDVSIEVQTKLLKVIEEGKFFRVGGNQEIQSHFKLVCATNKNLDELVKQGRFKEDFLARISTFQIEVPSLKDRPEDIPGLIASLLPQVCRESLTNISFEEIPEEFISALQMNPPRLNIRGLEMALHQLLTLSPKDSKGIRRFDRWKSIPEFRDLSARKKVGVNKTNFSSLNDPRAEFIDEDFPGLPTVLGRLEERIILEAKQKFGSNRRVAEKLRISESSVSIKMKHLEPAHRSKRMESSV